MKGIKKAKIRRKAKDFPGACILFLISCFEYLREHKLEIFKNYILFPAYTIGFVTSLIIIWLSFGY